MKESDINIKKQDKIISIPLSKWKNQLFIMGIVSAGVSMILTYIILGYGCK